MYKSSKGFILIKMQYDMEEYFRNLDWEKF